MKIFSQRVLEKADDLLNTPGGVKRDTELPYVWWVTPSAGGKRYRVQVGFDQEAREVSWVSCTCPNGTNKSGLTAARCYHLAAALMLLQKEMKKTNN